MKIRILPEAERDLEIGADFYESQGDGLGRYFNDCLMPTLNHSGSMPASMNNSTAFTDACRNDFLLGYIMT